MVVIRLRSLGDCVLCTPAIQLLKQARPDLDVRICVEDRFAAIFEQTLQPSARAIRAFAPDLCLNLHGGTRSARLTLLSGARTRAGFDIFKPAWIYNAPIPTAQEVLGVARRVHTAEHQASAVFYLGVPVQEIPRACVPALPGPSPQAPESAYAVIHPMASAPEKTWPASSFLQLASHLANELGLEPLFIGGPGDDLSAFQAFRTLLGTPLSDLARLVRGAALFIGNDSGPAHVAASFGTPQLVFFGPSDEEIWRPWRTPHQLLKANPIQKISVEEAIRALSKLEPRLS